MNNPDDIPISIEDEIEWLKDYKARQGLSWSALGTATGIASQTLNLVVLGHYQGNLENQARRIFKFRQKIESQSERSKSALAIPKFIATPSAKRFQFLLEVAHMGRITVAATGPGTGKTMTAREYQASISNVWMVTMRQSTSSLSAMISSVMDAMGLSSKSGWTRQRSTQVVEFLRNRGGLLIFDEANHMGLSSFEEIRGWHDETGVGVAFFGNEELLMRIRGGDKRHAYARLNSRIANALIQDTPDEADVDAFLNEFDIEDGRIRKAMINVALSPHNGGLREVKQILESANMLAIGEDGVIEFSHVEKAMGSRLTQHTRRAS